jgi:hypothetical protein
MARVIWVEILTRSGSQVAARYRCAGPALRIGRSYQGDVIVDDPAVAPDHLHVTQGEDGAILVEAASAASPFTIRGERRERSLVDGDTMLRIGHTSLRIRDEAYAVPAAAVVAEPKPRWIELSVLIVVALLINGTTLWLNEIAEPKVSRYVTGMVGLGAIVLLWSGLWALISRIFVGAARFPRHLAIASGAFLVYTVYTILAQALAFSLSSGMIFGNVATGFGVILGVACFLHLQVIAPSHAPIKAGIIAVLVVAGIAAQLANRAEQVKNGAQPYIAETTLPPAFRLARPKSGDQFFAAVDGLRGTLDADRQAGAAAP